MMKTNRKTILHALILLAMSVTLMSATCSKQKISVGRESLTVVKYGMEKIHELTFYFIDTGQEGMNVAILSGIHGNEIAAWGTSFSLLENFDFTKGKFLIVPKTNKFACDLNDRFPGAKHPGFYSPDTENFIGNPDYHDLNRAFPGDATGSITQRIAAVVTEVMDEFKPDLIIDLHESMNVHNGRGNFGNSVITPETYVPVAESAVAAINASGLTPELDFVALKANSGGMAISAYGLRYDIPTFLIETVRFEGVTPLITIPFERRIAQHKFMIRQLMALCGAL